MNIHGTHKHETPVCVLIQTHRMYTYLTSHGACTHTERVTVHEGLISALEAEGIELTQYGTTEELVDLVSDGLYSIGESLQRTATHCNTLQHTATRHTYGSVLTSSLMDCTLSVCHYNALQHIATHCNTLQHTATHCNTLQHGIHMGAC